MTEQEYSLSELDCANDALSLNPRLLSFGIKGIVSSFLLFLFFMKRRRSE